MYMHKLTWGFVYHYARAQINMDVRAQIMPKYGDLFIIMHMHNLTWGFVYHYAHAQFNMGICLSLCACTN